MSQKSIKKNYILNMCYQIMTMITPLITTPYLSRVLGADGIGSVSYAESIASYFVLFAAMGIASHGQREISYVQDSIEKRSIIFWNTKLLGLCVAGIVLVAYILFAVFQSNPVIYLILSLQIISVAVDVTWFFQGIEEFGKIVLRNMIFTTLNVVYILVAVHSARDVYLYAFGRVFFTLAGHISLWSKLSGYIQYVTPKKLYPFRDIKIVVSLFVPTIAIQVYTVLDKTMIGMITQSSYENGYYEQAMKIVRIVLTIVTSLGTVMIPRIGHYYGKKETEEVKRLMYNSYRFVWFLGIPLCFGLISVSANFVPWFFGAGFEKVVPLINILAFLVLAIGISNVTGMQYLIPTKRQSAFTRSVLIGASLNFCLNALLIPQLQSVGAAIASVAAEATIAIVQLLFVRKELSPARVLKEGSLYYFAGAVMAVGVGYLGTVLTASIVNTAILVIFGATVYFSILIILQDAFLLSNIKKAYSALLRKNRLR